MRVIFVLRLAYFIGFIGSASAQTLEVPAASRAALGIETAAVTSAARYDAVKALGVVEAPTGALMTAQTPFAGVVVRTLVIPGQGVKAGDAIAEVRSSDFPKAQADLEAAKMMRDHRAEIYERAQALYTLGLRSQEEADEAGHDAFEAALFYKAAQQRFALYKSGKTPGTFIMAAPGDGMVTALTVHSGDTLAVDDPVATVFGGETYWARMQISSAQGGGLVVGGVVRVSGSDLPGEIVAVNPAIDPATRSLEVMVSLPPGLAQRLGDVIDMTVESAAPDGAFSVPARSLVRMEGGDAVFLETAAGFVMTPVTVLTRSSLAALVRGPLQEGTRIAVSGVAALKNMAVGG